MNPSQCKMRTIIIDFPLEVPKLSISFAKDKVSVTETDDKLTVTINNPDLQKLIHVRNQLDKYLSSI